MIGRRKPKRDPVTPELVEALERRDIGCVLAFLQNGHECTDRWGDPCSWKFLHNPWAITVEHVKSDLRMGVRAPSDLAHTVLLCAGTNIGVPSRTQRNLMRHYLEIVRFAA